jgi:hypothetical protein
MPLIKFLEKPIDLGDPILSKWSDDQDTLFEFKIFENLIDENGKEHNPPLIKPNKKTADWKPGDEGELLTMHQDKYIKFVVCEYPWKNEIMPECDPYTKQG